MLKIGIVGTGSISSYFCTGVSLLADKLNIKVVSILSRKLNTAQQFAEENNIENYFDDFEEFAKSIDIVYVATPNNHHFEYALMSINAKKHVLIEKPIVTQTNQINQLYDLAQANSVVVMEAITNLTNEILNDVKVEIADEQIIYADFKMMQQSRHYPKIKSGEYVHAFDKQAGGGALFDLGVYLVYPLVYLFGKPNNTNYFLTTIGDRADLTSTLICEYDHFNASLTASKIGYQDNYNIIVTESKTIEFNAISASTHLIVKSPTGTVISEKKIDINHRFEGEIIEFINTIRAGKLQSDIHTKQLALDVSAILCNRK